jgi:hypothetical protein
MARSNWILPRPDAACGRAFHRDRRTAEGHRIALEFWDQATGRSRLGERLVTFRCKRCGGFHLARRRVQDRPTAGAPSYEIDIDGLDAGLELAGHCRPFNAAPPSA